MRFLVAITVSVWIFTGCGNSVLLMLDKDKTFKPSLDNTQKQQLKNGQTTLAIFRATYLNPIYPDAYHDKEYFFVGIHIQDDLKEGSSGINNPHYTLTLNDHNATAVEPVGETDKLYKSMPMVERWARYYVVGFDDNSTGKLNLVYKKDTKQSVKFTFPRYVKP